MKLRSEESSNDLRTNDKHLKKARHEAHRMKNGSTPDSLRAANKKEQLLEFERRLLSNNNPADLAPQPSKLVINHKQLLGQISSFDQSRTTTGLAQPSHHSGLGSRGDTEQTLSRPTVNTEPSEAVRQFTSEFDLMKKKFLEMQASMTEHLDDIAGLNQKVARL